jgi:hypothetical protein
VGPLAVPLSVSYAPQDMELTEMFFQSPRAAREVTGAALLSRFSHLTINTFYA